MGAQRRLAVLVVVMLLLGAAAVVRVDGEPQLQLRAAGGQEPTSRLDDLEDLDATTSTSSTTTTSWMPERMQGSKVVHAPATMCPCSERNDILADPNRPGAVVFGRVVDPAGRGLADICVVEAGPPDAPRPSDRTARDGSFRLEAPPDTSIYGVLLLTDCSGAMPGWFERIAMFAGGGRAHVVEIDDVVMTPAAGLRVRVVDHLGRPAGGKCLTLGTIVYPLSATGVTDIGRLRPGVLGPQLWDTCPRGVDGEMLFRHDEAQRTVASGEIFDVTLQLLFRRNVGPPTEPVLLPGTALRMSTPPPAAFEEGLSPCLGGVAAVYSEWFVTDGPITEARLEQLQLAPGTAVELHIPVSSGGVMYERCFGPDAGSVATHQPYGAPARMWVRLVALGPPPPGPWFVWQQS